MAADIKTVQARRKIAPRKPIAPGDRFGSLVAVAQERNAAGKLRWRCACDCGKESSVRACDLNDGNSASCGCMIGGGHRGLIVHGKTQTKAFMVWVNMRKRCYVESNAAYPHYGGRGIRVCERWHDFANFYADMGEPAEGMTLDRIDTDGNYEPANCRWATRVEQTRNQRNTLKWNGVPLAEVAETTGFHYDTLYYRLKRYGTPFPAGMEAPNAK